MAKSKSYVEISTDPSNTEVSSVAPLKERVSDVESLIKTVLVVVVVSVGAMILAMCAMLLDQIHFNNQTYREQSGQIETQIQQLQLQTNSIQRSQINKSKAATTK